MDPPMVGALASTSCYSPNMLGGRLSWGRVAGALLGVPGLLGSGWVPIPLGWLWLCLDPGLLGLLAFVRP